MAANQAGNTFKRLASTNQLDQLTDPTLSTKPTKPAEKSKCDPPNMGNGRRLTCKQGILEFAQTPLAIAVATDEQNAIVEQVERMAEDAGDSPNMVNSQGSSGSRGKRPAAAVKAKSKPKAKQTLVRRGPICMPRPDPFGRLAREIGWREIQRFLDEQCDPMELVNKDGETHGEVEDHNSFHDRFGNIVGVTKRRFHGVCFAHEWLDWKRAHPLV
jgi:hypothetical protein